MKTTVGDQLRNLLSQQARTISEEAVRSEGTVTAEQVDTLSRLARLVEIYNATQPSPVRKRWPVVAVLGSSLVLVSLLFFARVAETEIEGELALSEVSFIVPSEQVLTEAIDLSTLGVSGLREIRLPRAADQTAQIPRSSEGDGTGVRLSVAPNGKRQGTITLAPLKLPAETHVWISNIGVPRQYRISLKGTNAELNADVNGSVRVDFSGGGSEQINLESPDVAVMQYGENEVDLDLTLVDPTKNNFSSQLSANDLSFFHVKEFRDPTGTLVRPLSTILSGTINFESLNGLEQKIRPGEMIRFEHSQLEVRTLRLQDDKIELKFHGRVRGMNAGWGDSSRSLMPTWFEWIQARHSLYLLWGTALSLFGLVGGALRWWGKPL